MFNRHVAWPELLPGEEELVLTSWDGPGLGQLIVTDLQSRETASLELAGGRPYATTGHLVYGGVDASLMAVRFDVGSKRKTGAPVALLPDIAIARNNIPVFAFSDEGTLAFVTGFLPQSRREPQRLIRRFLASQPLPLPFTPDLFVRGPVLSHDGRRVAASTWSAESWILDLERGTRTKLPTQKFRPDLQPRVDRGWARRADGHRDRECWSGPVPSACRQDTDDGDGCPTGPCRTIRIRRSPVGRCPGVLRGRHQCRSRHNLQCRTWGAAACADAQ